MSTFAVSPLGVAAIDQAGTAAFTWAVSPTTSQGRLPGKGQEHVAFCLQFGNITGLTATVAITIDGVAGNPPMVTSTGVIVAAGGTITASDGMQVYGTLPIGATAIAITATAGSGNVELILHSNASAMIAAYAKAATLTPVADSTIWAVTHVPAENTVATINKAAPGAGLRHVVTAFSAIMTTSETAPTAGDRLVTLTQDPAGTPAVLWNGYIGIPAAAGQTLGVVVTGVKIPILTNKSVTLAFASAGGVDTKETVNMSGYIEAV